MRRWITSFASGSQKTDEKPACCLRTSAIACTSSAVPPIRSPLARVLATRTGMGSFPEGWAPGERCPEKWCRRFAIDFVGGDLKAAAPKRHQRVITLSSGEAKQIEILRRAVQRLPYPVLTGIRLPTQPSRWICVSSCAVG
ncbi:hypothetical protein ACNKHO_11135 [Shigella flexneri]